MKTKDFRYTVVGLLALIFFAIITAACGIIWNLEYIVEYLNNLPL